MDNIFIQLAIILGLSSAFGLITRWLKLPLVIAYLGVGLVLALTAVFDTRASNVFSFLPQIGIAFMLFLVGMELDLREIKSLGIPIFVSGVLQIIITSIIGSILAKSFHFGATESWYLGIGLSFSSTVVVVKLLSDRHDLTSLYGKLSLGVLLLEDLVAVFIILFLTSTPSIFDTGFTNLAPIISFVLKVVLLFAIAIILNKYFLSKLFNTVADSGELLFLTALAWCFIYVSLAIFLGFSVLIGAFLAGVALASSPYHLQIQSKVKPLRDFFVSLFFVYLGTQVNFSYISQTYILIILFTTYAVLAKPLFFLLSFGMFGFRKHTIFQAAINLTQVSEFSLILLLIGLQKNVVSPSALTVIALSEVLSMVISSLMITHGAQIYRSVSRFIVFFERRKFQWLLDGIKEDELKGHVVVIGSHRVGGEIIRLLKHQKVPQIVLDVDPHQVEQLLNMHIPVVYGDIVDPDVLDALGLGDARMIISTASSLEDNLTLLEELKLRKLSVPVIARAETIKQAQQLYKAGAVYVLIPELIAGDILVDKLRDHLQDSAFFHHRKAVELEKLTKMAFTLS